QLLPGLLEPAEAHFVSSLACLVLLLACLVLLLARLVLLLARLVFHCPPLSVEVRPREPLLERPHSGCDAVQLASPLDTRCLERRGGSGLLPLLLEPRVGEGGLGGGGSLGRGLRAALQRAEPFVRTPPCAE